MDKSTKTAVILIVVFVLGIISILAGTALAKKGNQTNGGMILFYSTTCPHCQIVEKFIADNGIDGKVSFVKKEVSNSSNSADLVAKAKICGIATDSIGVPLFWDGKTCLVGSEPIINFLKQKTNIQ
ncbi:MAG: hypothetical protein WCP18_03690 [bacterium]